MPRINSQRVLSDLRTLAQFGAFKTGVHRPTLSDDDIAARQWFAVRMSEAGLETEIDGIGNILGRSRANGKKLLAGSHLESQNHAGWLDGPLGCVYALEAARALSEHGSAQNIGVDVVVFCDEEGHFGSFLGSRSFIGLLEESELDAAEDRTRGISLRGALARSGWSGRPRHLIETDRYEAFFEAHIEQGVTLENAGHKIGVVSAIVGNWQYRVTAIGEQNHAGTTSMQRRRDAGREIIQLLAAVDARFVKAAGPHTVWTVGRINFEPGQRGIIPGRAEALLQFRDADAQILARLDAALNDEITRAGSSGRCEFGLERLSASVPAPMDERMQRAVETAAERHAPGLHQRMPSGAVHDAQILAHKIPTAMLFVPSIGGISHHWSEDTLEEDITLGAQVFADAIELVLNS